MGKGTRIRQLQNDPAAGIQPGDPLYDGREHAVLRPRDFCGRRCPAQNGQADFNGGGRQRAGGHGRRAVPVDAVVPAMRVGSATDPHGPTRTLSVFAQADLPGQKLRALRAFGSSARQDGIVSRAFVQAPDA